MLHSRYASISDLATYTDHPDHVSVVANYVKPVIDDVMAVDWVSDDFSGPPVISPGSVARFTVLKLKEGGIGKGEVLEVLRGVKGKFPEIEQLSVGENFSPGRAKGYSIASVAVFKGGKELEGLDLEMAEQEKDKVRELIDSVLVLDFPVQAAVQVASL